MLRRCALAFLFLVVLAVPAGANGRTTDGRVRLRPSRTCPEGRSGYSCHRCGRRDPDPAGIGSRDQLQRHLGGERPGERRADAELRGLDRPRHVPVPLLQRRASPGFHIARRRRHPRAAATTSRSPRPTRSTRARSNTRPTPISVRSFPVTASLTKTPTTEQVSFTSGGHAYDEYRDPSSRIHDHRRSTRSHRPGPLECDLEGPGLDCTVALAANATGTVTFETSGAASPARQPQT